MADNNNNVFIDQDFYGTVRFFGSVTFKSVGAMTFEEAITFAQGVSIPTTKKVIFDSATSQTYVLESGSGILDFYIGAVKALTLKATGAIFPKGLQVTARSMTADSSEDTGNSILANEINVEVDAVRNDANDFVVLPALADVPVGHTLKIACNAGSNFELRTPATSGEKINTVDCDGTQEYLCTDTEVVTVTKVSTTDGWVATGQTALGAIATAVVPD